MSLYVSKDQTLSILSQIVLLLVFNMDRLRMLQILKFCFLFNNPISKLFLSSHISLKVVKRNQDTLSIFHLDISSANFITQKFYLPQSARAWTQFCQLLCQYITRITFPTISTNVFLISTWDIIRLAFTFHISTNTLCSGLLRRLGLYTSPLFFLEPHENHL